ncbi:MAG: MG2 domain-containing protein [Marinagarivorans sp.]|nr:MG2 domain-containing protein [Marinagarivorans sp.]
MARLLATLFDHPASQSPLFFKYVLFSLLVCILSSCGNPKETPNDSVKKDATAYEELAETAEITKDDNESQSFDLRIEGLKPSNKTDMEISGQLTSSNVIAVENLEKFLIATYSPVDGSAKNAAPITLKPEWEAVGNDSYRFTFKNLKRTNNNQELQLQWDSVVIGDTQKGQKTLTLPALDIFQITATRSHQLPQQSIEVVFSEPLDGKQDLNGLITLNGQVVDAKIDGASLFIYPKTALENSVNLIIQDTLHSTKKISLPKVFEKNLVFASLPPSVRFVNKGNILPPNSQLSIPIETTNTRAIQITAFKIYENNLHYYLQRNSRASDNYPDNSTGRIIWSKTITLPDAELDKKHIYHLDLNALMAKHTDGIINLSVAMTDATSIYPCPARTTEALKPTSLTENQLDNYDGPENNEHKPNWFHQYYGDDNGYLSYSERNDPCSKSYFAYNSDKIQDKRNLWVSDLGIVAKQGRDDILHITATSINNGSPASNAKITVYNYQQQIISEGKTNSDGFWQQKIKGVPYVVSVENFTDKNFTDKNFLVVARNEALPTSQFDVSGETLNGGLKGFLYGERDLWRPGDDIYLSFILQNDKPLPENYPVIIDLFDARGTKIDSQTLTQPRGNIYIAKFSTTPESTTGTWRAIARAGGEYFDVALKVEAFIPNRLKIDLEAGEKKLMPSTKSHSVTLTAEWLNGASAKQLKADVNVKLRPKKTQFEQWQKYQFDDLASQYEQQEFTAFEGQLDAQGKAVFELNLNQQSGAPGVLQAVFVNRVFEQSGNFSTAIRSLDYYPYNQWAGIFIEEGEGYRGSIDRESDQAVQLITIDNDGKAVANQNLTIDVYSLDWRWWWDQNNENIANYIRSDLHKAIKHDSITTDANGKATWTLTKNTYEWGRHLVRVCQSSNQPSNNQQQCTGQIVYLGWSNNQNAGNAATELVLETDKDSYEVGDTMTVNLPASLNGRALYSIETGAKILSQQWQNISPSAHSLRIPITDDMAPNAYINVALILPHNNKTTDAPIRLYGINPIKVTNPKTHLQPIVTAPEHTPPESAFTLTVSEQKKRSMSYTLAIVDEGLLGVTGFNAPDPHDYFYRREALGVQTWDIFDSVVGAYGANLERLLRIGGDAAGKNKDNKHEQRFKPVVIFEGAFSLAAGETKTHTIMLPPYMGAVRVMVVASENKAYGKTEQTIKVTQPLTLLTTLPRVIGPQESLNMPVTLFVSDKNIKDVSVTVTASDIFNIEKNTQTYHFDDVGDTTLTFPLTVANKVGKGKITVMATSTNPENGQQESASETLYLESRSPNLPSTQSESKKLTAGEIWSPTLSEHGIKSTNKASVTAGILPPLNLQKRLEYLISYPHGCLEQTTSAVFPQLLLEKLTTLSTEQKKSVQNNINAALNKYLYFQLADGALSYWPGTDHINHWANIYATHFLVLAKAQGYPVSQTLLDKSLQYLTSFSKNFSISNNTAYGQQTNAYSLYVLALAKKPDLAAMNRFRETLIKNINRNTSSRNNNLNDETTARWLLASSYQLMGVNDAAQQLFNAAPNKAEANTYNSYYYGSKLQNISLLLIAQSQLGLKEAAWESATQIAKQLNTDNWLSTQSTAFSLIALASFSAEADIDQGFDFAIKESASDWQAIASRKTLQQIPLSDALIGKNLQIRNDGQQDIFVQVSNTGVPSAGNEKATANGLILTINYSALNGETLDIATLPQGKDFIANITVTPDNNSPSYKIEDIALTYVLPSGWQIRNERLEGDSQATNLDYQDIRDDRMLSYFSLWKEHYWHYRYSDKNQSSVQIKVVLNATYAGRYYLPTSRVNVMYDETTQANTQGQWVEVVAQ